MKTASAAANRRSNIRRIRRYNRFHGITLVFMANDPSPKEIREAYSEYSQTTSHIRDEGKIDMRFVSGDPWDPQDRLAREEAHRPCMSFDELNGHLSQFTGSIRQNPRAVEISPESEDADDKSAEMRANMIRGIEYRCAAQQSYTLAGDSMVQRSYGYARIITKPLGGKSFDLELCVEPIINPDTIIYNPRYRMPDGSDVTEAFEIDFISHAEFRRRFAGTAVKRIGRRLKQRAMYFEVHGYDGVQILRVE